MPHHQLKAGPDFADFPSAGITNTLLALRFCRIILRNNLLPSVFSGGVYESPDVFVHASGRAAYRELRWWTFFSKFTHCPDPNHAGLWRLGECRRAIQRK